MRAASFRFLLAWYRQLALLAFLPLLLSCDRGFEYRPVNWQATSEGLGWEKDFGSFSVRVSHLTGLLGFHSVSPEFEITNSAAAPLVLERAELRSDTRTFAGILPGQAAERWRIVAPGTTRNITVFWEFDKPAPEALGKQPSLILLLRVGGQRFPVEITYSLY